MSTITEYGTTTFEKLRCYSCAIEYFVPDHWRSKRLERGDNFFCPNGHEQHFTESTQILLHKSRVELASAKAQLRLEQDQKAAAEERLSRLQSRISKGVCPCCHRTVSQMAKHMAAKHPNWKK